MMMPHLKKPVSFDTLRPGRSPEKVQLEKTSTSIREFYAANKRKADAEAYWAGKTANPPSEAEREMADLLYQQQQTTLE